jgi:hypothetical protein
VDVTAAVALSSHQNVINQKGIGNYILLWVRPIASQHERHLRAERPSISTRPAAAGRCRVTLADLSATGPGGSPGASTEAARTAKGTELSARRALRYPGRALRRTRLDAQGGAPGRAFSTFYAAVARKDWPAVRALLSHRTLAVLAGRDSSGDQQKTTHSKLSASGSRRSG